MLLLASGLPAARVVLSAAPPAPPVALVPGVLPVAAAFSALPAAAAAALGGAALRVLLLVALCLVWGMQFLVWGRSISGRDKPG